MRLHQRTAPEPEWSQFMSVGEIAASKRSVKRTLRDATLV
jgi:hypothetical protein